MAEERPKGRAQGAEASADLQVADLCLRRCSERSAERGVRRRAERVRLVDKDVPAKAMPHLRKGTQRSHNQLAPKQLGIFSPTCCAIPATSEVCEGSIELDYSDSAIRELFLLRAQGCKSNPHGELIRTPCVPALAKVSMPVTCGQSMKPKPCLTSATG